MWFKNRTKLFRKRAVHRFKIFCNYWFKKRTEKEPVFVIALRRTGSNLLLSYLNSIPNASFAGEILNKSMSYGLRQRFISKKTVLKHIAYSIQHRQHRLCGAKFVKIHLETHRIGLLDLKSIFPALRFIILYRKSIFDQFVSLKIAQVTNTWQWTSQFKLPLSLRISPKEFQEYCVNTKMFYTKLLKEEWLKSCSVVLSYEDLAGDVQALFNESVFPFLKFSPTPIQSDMVKQNTKDPREFIENYEEIEPYLSHPLAWQEYSGERVPVLEPALHVA